MSFSQLTKNDLARFMPQDTCCLRSELAAFLVFNGAVQMSGGARPGLSVSTEMPDTARKIVNLAHKGIGAQTEVSVRRRERLQKNLSYQVRIIPRLPLPDTLAELGLMGDHHQPLHGLPWPILRQPCCRWSFLRGAFLAKGSITDPEKTYHWEISIEDELLGEDLIELVELQGLGVKLAKRKQGYIVYSKGSEEIASLLAGMGAYKAVLSLENTKVVKEMRNTVNRQVNCETANLDKTVSAAMEQVEVIRHLEQSGALSRLPDHLRSLAELRLENPSASLRELGQLLDPPVAKSTVASRMRRILQQGEK